ncbi:MAG: radical SAM protein [Anaerolineaceae bacterium]|nr:radical SAM protein [Anaerolineaceae bacterium]
MANLVEQIKAFFTKKQKIDQGFFEYHSKPEEELQYRLHLRVEPTGEGVLIVNASTVLHLNQTAVEIVHLIMQDIPLDDVINKLRKRYNASKDQITKDTVLIRDRIMTLISTPDLDPVTYLGMERQAPHSELSAPYRLDCALTYKLNSGHDPMSAPRDRVSKDLTTQEWLSIIKKAFDAGIPHIIFTGGEPTLREDLPELLLACENLGMVTGLISDGVKLVDRDYVLKLIANGLDHLMLLFDPGDKAFWKTLEMILKEDLFTTVHLTLTPELDLQPIIERLAEMKVNAISLSTSDPSLGDSLQTLRDLVAINQVELVWDMPAPYSRWNPIAMELEETGTTFANLYVEPDGDVLPAQGINQVMGNMVTQAWDQIWQNKPDL